MLPKNTKLSDLANAIGMPDQTAVNNRNALKAKRYDEMLVEIATLEARIKELEAALEKAEVVVTHHHEIGHIIHAYENMREDCDVCKKFDYKVFRLVTK